MVDEQRAVGTPGENGRDAGREGPGEPSDETADGLSRRRLLKGAAVAAAAAASVGMVGVYLSDDADEPGGGSGGSPGRDEEPGGQDEISPITLMPARPADALASSVGVVTHFHFRSSVYGQTNRVLEAVAALGVRHVRNRLALGQPTRYAFNQLPSLNVQVEAVCGAYGDPQSMREVMDHVVRHYPDPFEVFSAFEGINEPNQASGDWIAETRAKTRDLFLERNAHGLGDIPIVGPSMARVRSGGSQGNSVAEQSENLGDLTEFTDLGNVHIYPRGMTPGTGLERFVRYQRAVCNDQPIVCSEGGYNTARNYRGGASPVPEEVAGKYMPRAIMEHWVRGNERFYIYELLDDYDPRSGDLQSNFGMMRVSGEGASARWTPKSAYHAVRNFISILADKGDEFEPQGLQMAVDGASDVKTSLVAKRDGTRYLLLWRDVNSYDHTAEQLIHVFDQPVTVRFEQQRDVRVFSPTRSGTSIRSRDAVASVEVQVADELLIVEIR